MKMPIKMKTVTKFLARNPGPMAMGAGALAAAGLGIFGLTRYLRAGGERVAKAAETTGDMLDQIGNSIGDNAVGNKVKYAGRAVKSSAVSASNKINSKPTKSNGKSKR